MLIITFRTNILYVFVFVMCEICHVFVSGLLSGKCFCIYPVFGELFGDNGTEHSGERSHSVGESHQDAGVTWSDVQVVDVEACNYAKSQHH